jgi:hypothetical protein
MLIGSRRLRAALAILGPRTIASSLVLAVAFVASGSAQSDDEAPPSSHTEVFPTAGFVAVSDDQGQAKVDPSQFAVFRRGRTKHDELPPMFRRNLSEFFEALTAARGENAPGELILDESRLAFSQASEDLQLYAVPTTNEWICVLAPPDIGGVHCSRGLIHGLLIAVSERPIRFAVYGLATDSVKRVDAVTTTGDVHEIPVQGNGFLSQFDRGSRSVGLLASLQVHHADGRCEVLPLDSGGTRG